MFRMDDALRGRERSGDRMGRLGFWEIALILGVALILFGRASRIGEIGKGLGEGIRNFKRGLRDEDEPAKLPGKKTDDDGGSGTT